MYQQKNKIITLEEYGELPLSELEQRVHRTGIDLIKRLNLRHKVELFKLFHDRLKATQYVGFVKIRDHTIQVIPKIFGENTVDNLHFLLQLLKYTRKIRIKEHDLGNLSMLKDDFFEVIIYLFAKNLRELLRRDFKKSYVSREENLCFLKGKLMLKEQLRRNFIDNTKYFCNYEEFTENNLMNQVFKHTTNLLLRVSASNSNKKLLEDILTYLCDVELALIKPSDFSRIHFTRLNRQYEPLVNLCKMILENTSVQFRASKLETFVFMFDMNRLFEEFVFEFIRRNKAKILVNGCHRIVFVKAQVRLGKLFDEFLMRGDILIQDGTGKKILVDTKYKMLADDLIHYGLSQADFYQMFAYSISQQQKYRDIILLYPLPEGESFSLKRTVLTHRTEQEAVNVYLRTIQLTRIFDRSKQRINENDMISELNNVFNLAESRAR